MDDSARFAGRPRSGLATLRALESRGVCIASRSARTGSSDASRRTRIDIRVSPRSWRARPAKGPRPRPGSTRPPRSGSRDRRNATECLADEPFELRSAQRHCARSRAEEIRAAGFEQLTLSPNDLAQPSPEPVADDRGADRPPDRERDGRRGRIVGSKHSDRDGTRAVTSSPREGTKGLTAVDASDQAESLARP
jgi:hypothetical protein